MQIITQSTQEITAASLAAALADCEPQYFADFWLEFNRAVKAEKLDEFAAAMSPELGANRKHIFRRLERLISYYEEFAERSKRSPSDDTDD